MAKPLSAQMKSLKAQQVAQKEKAIGTTKKSPIKEQSKKNAMVSVGSKSAGLAVKKVGIPLNHTNDKHDVLHATGSVNILSQDSKVGMNIGVTKNMDNYESLRVDVWATDLVQEGETLSQAHERLGAELKEALEEVIDEYLE
jgi:hypothetical protein